MKNLRHRPATIADASQIAIIYAHHMLNGTATFDFVPPSEVEWRAKILAILAKRWPFIVTEIEGEVA